MKNKETAGSSDDQDISSDENEDLFEPEKEGGGTSEDDVSSDEDSAQQVASRLETIGV